MSGFENTPLDSEANKDFKAIIDLGSDELSKSEFPFLEALRDDIINYFAEDVYDQISEGYESRDEEYYLKTHARMIAELGSLKIKIYRHKQTNDNPDEIEFSRIPAVNNPNFDEPRYIIKYTIFIGKDGHPTIDYKISKLTTLSQGTRQLS